MWEGILEDTVPGKTEKTRKNDFILSTLGNFLKKNLHQTQLKSLTEKKLRIVYTFMVKLKYFECLKNLKVKQKTKSI